MKKIITKRDIRTEIEKQIDDYLNQGGEVEAVPQGVSGRESADGPIRAAQGAFQEPKQERTYVPEVVAALDARKQAKKKPAPAKKSGSRPRKRIIYDDFGEPLRWEWVED